MKNRFPFAAANWVSVRAFSISDTPDHPKYTMSEPGINGVSPKSVENGYPGAGWYDQT